MHFLTVSLTKPGGTLAVELTRNEVKIRDFPDGQTVSLGSLFGCF
jgi:hypothetical protein